LNLFEYFKIESVIIIIKIYLTIMKNIRKKVRFCILSNLLLLIIITIPIVILDTGESSYFRYGWSDDLILISFPVNTKMRYMIVCLYIIVIKASTVIIS
jgi:hypothetical protein